MRLNLFDMYRLLVSLLLCFTLSSTFAQEHFYDFIYYGESSNPTNFYKVGNTAYFTAVNKNSNLCLYKTDGSKTGTELVYEYNNGASHIRNFVELGERIFFMVYTPKGTQIWYTKGDVQNTKMFYQSQPFHQNREIDLYAFNDWFFYQDQVSEDSFYVRRIDTSLTNNIIVARHKHGYQYGKGNFVSTSDYLFYGYNDLLYRVDKNFDAKLYWERSASTAGDIPYLYSNGNTIIWHMRNYSTSKTDVYAVNHNGGSPTITATLYGYPSFYDWVGNGNFFYYIAGEFNGWPRIYRLNTLNYNHTEIEYAHTRDRKLHLEVYNDQVYFSGFVNGDCELYKVGNLSSSPTKVSDIANDTSSNPQSFITFNNKLYFSAYERKTGRELYVTEGAASNTKLAFDFLEGPLSSLLGINSIEINGKLLLSGTTIREGNEIWVSDGTDSGTELLMNVNPKVDRGNQQLSSFMPVGDYLYLFANDSINGAELWRTDGSEEGTIFLDNINIANFPSGMEEYIEFKGNLYGTAISFFEGVELYTSNGTPQGSKFVTPSDLFSSSYPHDYVVDGNYFYYIGSTGLFGGQAIFRSDGTKAGTKVYLGDDKDIEDIANLTKVGGMMCVSIKRNGKYGAYYVDTKNEELKALDMVDDLGHSDFFCGNDSIILFLHLDATGGLYQSNITPPNVGTGGFRYDYKELNKTIMPDTFFMADSSIAYMVAQMTDNSKKVISYRSFDKTTQINKGVGINPIINYSNVKAITGFGTKAIFSAFNSTYGQELFITDGTDSGVVLLADINSGSASSDPDNFYVFNDRLIFTATTAANGTEVWITDGTTAGTKLLWDIQKGNGSSYPTEYAAYKGYLYISASDSIREKSLYRFIIDSCDIIAPEVTSNKNSFVVCEGETIDLYAKTGIEVEKLTWYKNGNSIITAGDTFTTNEVGKYKFEVANGSCALSSSEIELKSAPAVNFIAGFESDSGFCEGGSLSLVASGDNDLSVKWYRDGEEYSSQLKTTTFADGEFFAIGRNQFGCRDTSRTLFVEVYENPKPDVTLISDTLWSTATGVDYTYQWIFKGVEIPGETNEYVAPKENGAYKVEVTNDKGCAGESNGFKYEGSSIDDLISPFKISAYPNPFAQNSLISYELPNKSFVQIEVYNELGQKIETIVETSQSAGSYQFEFNANTQGIYHVKLQIGEAQTVIRLVKNQ